MLTKTSLVAVYSEEHLPLNNIKSLSPHVAQ